MISYQNLWDTIKLNGVVSFQSHPVLHKRIFKGIKKRKNLDLLYKFEKHAYYCKLHQRIKGDVVTVILTETLRIENLGADDVL